MLCNEIRLKATLIANRSAEQLMSRPRPDKWSVAEILAHLAEDEIATAWRYRQMVEHTVESISPVLIRTCGRA